MLVSGHILQDVHLVARSGLEVDLAVKRPASAAEGGGAAAGAGARPLILILGGFRTGREAARLIDDTHGMVVAALSYPFHGDARARGPSWIGQVPAIRAAVLDTPPAVMLALDYLLARPDVRSDQVELVGVSLGAPFACVAAALDRRVTRAWSIHGAGKPLTLIDFNLKAPIPFAPARALVAGLMDLAISGPRMAPERWVARIAPRPFIMINAEKDERIPRAAVETLYRSAREPKEIHWIPGPHVQPRDVFEIEELAELVFERVMAHPAAPPAGPRPAGTPGDGTP